MAKRRAETEPESETLLAHPETRHEHPAPLPTPHPSALHRLRSWRGMPFLRLLAYYVLVVLVLSLLVQYVPAVRRAFLSPEVLPLSKGSLLRAEEQAAASLDLAHALDRSLTTLLVICGALVLVVPVARVYMFTKRFRYDPALVRSVIILPIVVAGIVLVVKNSIALAFSLAGIVAAVRFRNNLKDPRDAVYIFLVLGIGLSAGVQALDVALVMSFAFNLVVLYLWQQNVGSIYGGRYGRTGIPAVGDSALFLAQEPLQQREVRRRFLDDDAGFRPDGILLVHSAQPEMVRITVQEALGDLARDWSLADIEPRDEGMATLYYMVRMKESVTPPDMVGALDERWSSQVAGAEYLPFRVRKKKRRK
ncbi:MAG: hypothetical protein JWM27_1226 [Gemmatimonadetes bacterium]|nr:hypothetical protein [Gemmatimonadota bacterium]